MLSDKDDAFNDVDIADDKSVGGSLSQRRGSQRGRKKGDTAEDVRSARDSIASLIEQAEAGAPKKKKTSSPFREEDIWLAFNKYLYTLVLLFMATFHFNLLGFFYFALFLLHTFAFYSFRCKSLNHTH